MAGTASHLPAVRLLKPLPNHFQTSSMRHIMDDLFRRYLAIKTTIEIARLRSKVSMMSYVTESIALVWMPRSKEDDD